MDRVGCVTLGEHDAVLAGRHYGYSALAPLPQGISPGMGRQDTTSFFLRFVHRSFSRFSVSLAN
jgi:hypothetical protein